MPATKVIKPKPVEASRKTLEKTKPVQVRVRSELPVPAVRKSRASSCSRCPQRERSERSERSTGAQQRTATKPSCERRARSTSTALKTNWPRTDPDNRKATNSVQHAAAVSPKCRDVTACPGQREQRSVRGETKRASQSHKAFTVIPPNPKKRREIQRKAEAELAALEELRLSRAMAYVSINPSSVGGCMSLEEVRSKQQQEMMQAKRKQKPMKTQLMEETSVLNS